MSQNPDSQQPPDKSRSVPLQGNEKPTKEEDEESNKSSTSSQLAAQIKERTIAATKSMKRLAVWTLTDFFDFNPMYLCQMRGLMNALQVILSLLVIILVSVPCSFQPNPRRASQGFLCKPPETFLLVASCGAFFTSLIYLFCCLLSKKTEKLLFETSFEVSYFLLYFILLFTASMSLNITAMGISDRRPRRNYVMTQTASILGLLNSALYGLCSIIFFISHQYYDERSEINVNA